MRAWVCKGICAAAVAFGATACTGDQTDEGTPEVSKEEAAPPAGEAEASAAPTEESAAPEGEAKADPGLDAMDAAQPGNAVTPADEAPMKAVPPPQEAAVDKPITEPTTGQPGPAKVGQGKKKSKGKIAASPGGRVVRYVKADAIDIHGQASESAPTVGHLGKGDIVMVVEDGEWGRISDNMFVRLSALSPKAVPRPVGKEAAWTPPKG